MITFKKNYVKILSELRLEPNQRSPTLDSAVNSFFNIYNLRIANISNKGIYYCRDPKCYAKF